MTKLRSPQESKVKDCKNKPCATCKRCRNKSETSRRLISRNKQLANSTARQKMNHQLRTCDDYEELDTTDGHIGKWEKVHNEPSGVNAPTKSDLVRRANKDRARMDLDMQFAHEQLTESEPMYTTEDVEHYTRNNTEFE